ncbi:MAG: ABC transporter substrate-binding protein, partial [Acidimicrobiia bacterium]
MRASSRLFVAVVALAIVAAACGDDGGSTSATTAATTATTASSSATTASATTAASTATSAGSTATTAAGGDILGTPNAAKGDPVKIGFFDDGKSPAVDNSDDFVVAEATVKYLNAYGGGIAGRPIELVHCIGLDDGAIATDCGNKFAEAKVNAALLSTSGRSGELYDAVSAAGIPFICGGCSVERQSSDAKASFLLVNGLAGSLGFPAAYAAGNNIKSITSLVIGMPAAVDPMVLAQAASKAKGITHEVVSIPPGTPDMIPQVTAALAKKPEMISIVGDPTFCLTAITALNELSYKGVIQTADYCVNAETWEPIPADVKTKVVVGASVAMGLPAGSNKDWDLYQAIMKKYASKEPIVSGVRGWAYQTVWALYLGTKGGGITATDITPASVAAAMKMAPAQPLPLAYGITFMCVGNGFRAGPAYCTTGALQTTLDKDGNFA